MSRNDEIDETVKVRERERERKEEIVQEKGMCKGEKKEDKPSLFYPTVARSLKKKKYLCVYFSVIYL
jgi:hypothetical protein